MRFPPDLFPRAVCSGSPAEAWVLARIDFSRDFVVSTYVFVTKGVGVMGNGDGFDFDQAATEDRAAPVQKVAEIALPDSGLVANDVELLRYNKDKLVASHKLESIRAISLETNRSVMAMMLGFIFPIAGIWAKPQLESEAIAWTVLGVLCFVGLLCILGATGVELVVNTAHGPVRYFISDSEEDANAFVVAVRERISEN